MKLNENSIRPNIFNDDKEIAYKKDLLYLLSMKKYFVDVPCPACNKYKNNTHFTKNLMKYLNCSKCGTIYISPRPTNRILNSFYKNSEGYKFWNKYIFPASEKSRINNIFIPRVDRIIDICNKYNVDRDVFVEVGCGFGSFLKEINNREYFNKVIGIEPSKDLSISCKNKGLNIINNSIDNVNISRKVDVIASFEVIEHLNNPHEFINKCKEMLNYSGLLVITCPNVNGFDNRILGINSPTFDHEHLNYFTPKSLSILLKRVGFNILEISTPGKLDVDIVRNRYACNKNILYNNMFIKDIINNVEISNNFQKFLSDNLLSGHLWVVARKIKNI